LWIKKDLDRPGLVKHYISEDVGKKSNVTFQLHSYLHSYSAL